MAKKLTPGVFGHREFLQLSLEARYAFLGLDILAQGTGRVPCDLEWLRVQLFPDIIKVDVAGVMASLEVKGLIGKVVPLHDEPHYILMTVTQTRAVRKVVETITNEIQTVFDHWVRVHEKPRAKLDDKRKKLIRLALAGGYKAEDLCQCIDGYKRSPFHQGENEDHKKYNDIELFLRDAKHIDQGLEYFDTGGKPGGPGGAKQGGNPAQKWNQLS